MELSPARPWFKLWREKIRSSDRVRALRPYDAGVYFRLLCACDDKGKLRSGTRPWDFVDVAEECGARRSLRSIDSSLDRLKRRDLIITVGGFLVVANFSELQE